MMLETPGLYTFKTIVTIFNTLCSKNGKDKTIYLLLMSTGYDECIKRVSSYVYKCMNQNVKNIQPTSQNGSNSHDVGSDSSYFYCKN